MTCPNCQTNLPEGSTFCGTCGTLLSPAFTPPPAAQAPGFAPPAPAPAPEAPAWQPATDNAAWQQPQPVDAPAQSAPAPAPAPEAPAWQPAADNAAWQQPQPVDAPAQSAPAPAPAPTPEAPAWQPAADSAAWQQPQAADPYAQSAPAPAPAPVAPAWQPGVGNAAQPPVYGQPPYGSAQPVYAAPAPTPEKKKTGGKKILFIVLALVLVGAIIASLLIFVGLRSSKDVVRDAVANTFVTWAKDTKKISDSFGLGDIWAQQYTSPTQTELSFSLSEQGGPASNSFGGSVISHYDPTAQRMDADASFSMAGIDLIKLNLAADGDLLAISSPQLFDDSYGFYGSTLGRDFNESTLAELTGQYLDDDFSLNFTGSTSTASSLIDADTTAQLGTLYNDLWENATVEKQGKATTAINGTTQECTVYQVTFTDETIITFLEEAMRSLLWDDSISSTLLASMRTNWYYEDMTEDEILNELLDDFYYDYLSGIYGDVTLTAYVQKGLALKMELALEYDYSDTGIILEFGDGQALINAFTLTVRQDGETEYQLQNWGNKAAAGGVYTSHYALQTYDYYEEALVETFNGKIEFDSAKQYDNFVAEFTFWDDYGDAFIFDVAGSVNIDAARKTMELDFNDISIGNEYTMLDASIYYSIAPSANHQFASVDPILLFELSESELEDLMVEIQTNVSDTVLGLGSLL